MMKSAEVAGTQHEFRDKLIETIGIAKTDSFYNAWLKYHFTKTDVDSMKSWGFNSIRVALHYIWFTPAIEDEPVSGKVTWIDKGFEMTDSLLKWCSDNEMYLILDMHGAPGGQGKNADISDYDPTKPSLWESTDNQNKLLALWKKLAERYCDEPWVGGYDLINEPNWDFENSGNENGCNCTSNTPLVDLFEKIIDTIRKVDNNHIVFTAGNCWGNNYNGLNSLASYDDNLVFSFHKYWNYNNSSSLQWIIDKRNNLDVPVWLGESGENSNTWFTNAINLCETNHIGWSWWPVKKSGINNVLRVVANEDYLDLIEYWKGNADKPSEEEAFQAVLKWAENHKIENCIVQRDVIDAMIRQPWTTAVKPYHTFEPGDTIFSTEYDMGRNHYAYYDTDTADYHTVIDYTAWNSGHSYRNDGVDIEACEDSGSNGYNVGWTADGEWVQYTLQADSSAGYTLRIRHASGGSGAIIHLELDNIPLTDKIEMHGTGGWQKWQTFETNDIIVPAGLHKVKLIFDKGGSNLHFFQFSTPVPTDSVDFKHINAQTSTDGNHVFLALNKQITSSPSEILSEDFKILNNDIPLKIGSFSISENENNLLDIALLSTIYYGTSTTIAYNGKSVLSNGQPLMSFSALDVENKLPVRYAIPGKIEAGNFYLNNGFVLEECSDAGGGYNTGYANPGDYLDYLVHVGNKDNYSINFRVATTASKAKVGILLNNSGNFVPVDTIQFSPTGGWQNWQTQSTILDLPEGRYTLRLLTLQGEHNLNWLGIDLNTAVSNLPEENKIAVYPVIAENSVHVSDKTILQLVQIYNLQGKLAISIKNDTTTDQEIDISFLPKGIYFIQASDGINLQTSRFIKK